MTGEELPDVVRVFRRARQLLVRRTVATLVIALAATVALAFGGRWARGEFHPDDRPDTPLVPPTALAASVTDGDVVLSWAAAVGAPPAAGYVVRRDPRAPDARVDGTTYRDEAVAPGTTYRYEVAGVDDAGAESAPAMIAVALFGPAPLLAPVADVRAAPARGPQVRVTWSPASDVVMEYVVHRNGERLASVSAGETSYVDTDVAPGGRYVYDVEARDASGLRSPRSATAVAGIPAGNRDTEPPSPPTGVTVSYIGSNPDYEITWEHATDNVAVTEYRVYFEGTWVGSVPADRRRFVDKAPRGLHDSYSVTAVDGAGNESRPTFRNASRPQGTTAPRG